MSPSTLCWLAALARALGYVAEAAILVELAAEDLRAVPNASPHRRARG
jgi:hypothetical protein